MRLSVVIPCHNEAQGIASVIRSLPEGVSEIIVVDNNSSDDTGKIAAAAGANVVFEKRPGHGSAVRAGFRVARGDIIATLDGDGQYPAQAIADIVRYLEANSLDFVVASRLPLSDRAVMTCLRLAGNILLTAVINLLFGLRLHDGLSSMLVFRRAVLERVQLESYGMPFSSEIKARAAAAGFRIGEYHIPYAARLGASKLIPWKHGLAILLFLLKLRLELWRSA